MGRLLMARKYCRRRAVAELLHHFCNSGVTMARMKRLQFMIEPELDAALEQAAAREGGAKATLLRRWIRQNVVAFPPIEEDPLWQMIGSCDGGLLPGETVDDVIYGPSR